MLTPAEEAFHAGMDAVLDEFDRLLEIHVLGRDSRDVHEITHILRTELRYRIALRRKNTPQAARGE